MSIVDDLEDYKYETSFKRDPERILHTSYKVDRAKGFQRVAVVETWSPRKPELGCGTFGTVRLEERIDGNTAAEKKYRAVKRLHKAHLRRLNVDYRKEVIALTKFTRPKFVQYEVFVRFFGWFEDEDSIFIAMEYIEKGTLERYISARLMEQDVKSIALQMLTGLKIMHEEGFTHRDLKPQNIFVVQDAPNWWIKIGDFGITKRVSNTDTALRTTTGTQHYLAPEISHYVVEGEDEESDTYTNTCDIWSLACVVYEMITTRVPFPKYPRDLVSFCRGGPFPEGPMLGRMSSIGIEFIKSIMVPLPSGRPAAKDLINTPWLRISRGEMSRSSSLHECSSSNSLSSINSPSGIGSERVGFLDYEMANKELHALSRSPLTEVWHSKKDENNSKPPPREVSDHCGRGNNLKDRDASETDEPAPSSPLQPHGLLLVPLEEMDHPRGSSEEQSEAKAHLTQTIILAPEHNKISESKHTDNPFSSPLSIIVTPQTRQLPYSGEERLQGELIPPTSDSNRIVSDQDRSPSLESPMLNFESPPELDTPMRIVLSSGDRESNPLSAARGASFAYSSEEPLQVEPHDRSIGGRAMGYDRQNEFSPLAVPKDDVHSQTTSQTAIESQPQRLPVRRIKRKGKHRGSPFTPLTPPPPPPPKCYHLKVTVISCSNLPTRLFVAARYYVKVTWGYKTQRTSKRAISSRVKAKGERDPCWNEELDMGKSAYYDAIVFSVYDKMRPVHHRLVATNSTLLSVIQKEATMNLGLYSPNNSSHGRLVFKFNINEEKREFVQGP